MPDYWESSNFIWSRRFLFLGKAGSAHAHSVNAIKISLALKGALELNVAEQSSLSNWNSHEALIIDAGTKHRMRGGRAACIALLYVLPQSDEAARLKKKYLSASNVYEIPERLVRKLKLVILSHLLPQTGQTDKLRRKLQSLDNAAPDASAEDSLLKSLERHYDCEGHWYWNERKAHEVCQRIISELLNWESEEKQSPSTELSKEIFIQIREVIEYIYSEIDFQVQNKCHDKRRFEPSFIVENVLNLPGWTEPQLVQKFKEETGLTIPEYVHQLEMRAALEQIGICQKKRKKIELAKKIAKLFDLKPGTFTKRVNAMLGISPRKLANGTSRFVPCEKISDRIEPAENERRRKELEACACLLEKMSKRLTTLAGKKAEKKAEKKRANSLKRRAAILKWAAKDIRSKIQPDADAAPDDETSENKE